MISEKQLEANRANSQEIVISLKPEDAHELKLAGLYALAPSGVSSALPLSRTPELVRPRHHRVAAGMV